MQQNIVCGRQKKIWIRHASDYAMFYIASKEVTAQQIQTAEQILTLAAEYLQEEKADE